MATMIKAIETRYSGYRFRSRLEARYAVFFDTLGITWEYEKEGYNLGDAGMYLPDFWLPQVGMWAEVKPGAFSQEEIARCEALVSATGASCLMLDGVPDATNYWAVEYCGDFQEPDYMDYVMGEPHMYHLSEGRFFCSSGMPYPEKQTYPRMQRLVAAVNAARSARFEHGESGAR